MDEKIWIHSTDEENWGCCDEFNTKEEAIKAGKEDYNCGFFVGTKHEYTLDKNIIDVEKILEQVSNDVYNDNGEYAEGYLHDTEKEHEEELQKELNEVFHRWIGKYNYKPNFYLVKNIEEIEWELESEVE
jgi:hypothetical protein